MGWPRRRTNTQTHAPSSLREERETLYLTITPRGLETPSYIPHASIKRAVLLLGSKAAVPSSRQNWITEPSRSRRGGEGSQLRVITLKDTWTKTQGERQEERKSERLEKGNKKSGSLALQICCMRVAGFLLSFGDYQNCILH